MPYEDIEKQKDYQKAWNAEKYQANKEKILERNRNWKKDNRDKIRNYNKLYDKQHPWVKVYASINQRCNNSKNCSYDDYGAKGIKCLITVEELKELWFRDKAYLLGKPSIDRIDSKGNYEKSNCRWIEFIDNCSRQYRERVIQ